MTDRTTIPLPPAISRKMACAILDDGRIAPFTDMFDEDGDATSDAELAAIAVAKHPDGVWLMLVLEEYEPVATH